ncbi:MAG: hypothetical protein F6K22_35865 [Okeania sp. SIO2F4]|uniref:Stf0 family sulfotransferase n=1 Tax=Okeania sp. SIO2F4 TaxID=2607790 RepID=UPI00142CD424|nr:Stf0 family sulfotransferase [Okeania sp. SIO2F4]NES07696.1 hypothetical protein [Okeania sp. SIO2F4]
MYDIFNIKNIEQSYIVCSTGRSGSTLLCRTLKQFNHCGNPEEYFHHYKIKQFKLKGEPDNFISYFNSVVQEGTTNGIFGMKMHWWQMYELIKLAKESPLFEKKKDIEILNSLFPNLKFIYIWRQDMIAQAVSTIIALQRKVWNINSSNSTNEPNLKKEVNLNKTDTVLKFQPLSIYKWEQKFQDQNRRWKIFFKENNLNYYEVTYENLTSCFEEEIKNVLEFLGIDKTLIPKEIKMATQKVSTDINQKYIDYYKMFPKLLLKALNKLDS